ncbi:MAG: MFS transporter [Oscillospiraceae bacterium]|nr:MFS transporter [Oscillospiraceae bacterium]
MIHLLLAVIYLSFISLGLPDSLLGSAWPTMYPQFSVPISYAGMISMTISVCTIVSSLFSDRLTRRFGAGKVTAASVALTAAALFGFSVSPSFRMLLVLAVPYGLGAGGVDAALNNYVAVHYASRHMSWLHCMWGIGAAAGPYLMSFALTSQRGWRMGYRYVAVIQIVLTVILLLSLPLWKGRKEADPEGRSVSLSIPQVLSIPGAKPLILAFFCYCALEHTAILWGSSYLVHSGLSAETAAGFASLFLIGLTLGRAANGFLTFKLNDVQLIRMGLGIIAVGVVILLLPLSYAASLVGLVIIGLGCAPVYPCIIHFTPGHFGADRSQAIIGIQMAAAYTGSLTMAPLFGLMAQHITIALFPWFLLALLAVMAVSHEILVRKTTQA